MATTTQPDGDVISKVSEWVKTTRDIEVFVGPDVAVSLSGARDLLKHLEISRLVDLNLTDQDVAPDTLRALCRILFLDCSDTPSKVLSSCRAIHEALERCAWRNDELEERIEILCSLAFVAWRAARLLGNSRESQRWEAIYRRMFRGSLQWQVLEASLSLEKADVSAFSLRTPTSWPEGRFQALLYLQDEVDSKPQRMAETAGEIYSSLLTETGAHHDIQAYLLGATARLAGAALKHNEREAAVGWLDLAEEHFRSGVDPTPELARVLFTRLCVSYTYDRPDLVLAVIPMLDATFTRFEMDEDQVKCRILWSLALKGAGRVEEALDILGPLQDARSKIRPALYGYVLREYGDLHQISGDYVRGFAELTEAARLLMETRGHIGLPAVIGMIGFGYRAQGMLPEAVKFFTESQKGYSQLGMKPYAAYSSVLVAETLLAMGRSKEAAVVLLSVLPSIESDGMVTNAVAALGILREAIRQQKLDPEMLRELRERLRPGGN